MSIHQRNGDWTVADPAAHDRAVKGMFSRIAGVYDSMNHFLSFNRDKVWRRNVVDRLDDGTDLLLDICAGTGDLGIEALACGKTGKVIASDFCTDMLRAGSEKGLGRTGGVPAVAADAQCLPFRERSMDAVVVGFGVRNLADLKQGIAEVRQVLKPGGLYMVLDFYRPDPGAQDEAQGVPAPIRWYLDRIVPMLGRIFGGSESAYSYLSISMGRFVTPNQYADLLREADFRDIFIARQTFGIAHIVGGRAP